MCPFHYSLFYPDIETNYLYRKAYSAGFTDPGYTSAMKYDIPVLVTHKLYRRLTTGLAGYCHSCEEILSGRPFMRTSSEKSHNCRSGNRGYNIKLHRVEYITKYHLRIFSQN